MSNNNIANKYMRMQGKENQLQIKRPLHTGWCAIRMVQETWKAYGSCLAVREGIHHADRVALGLIHTAGRGGIHGAWASRTSVKKTSLGPTAISYSRPLTGIARLYKARPTDVYPECRHSASSRTRTLRKCWCIHSHSNCCQWAAVEVFKGGSRCSCTLRL